MNRLLLQSIEENKISGAYLLVGSLGQILNEGDSFIMHLMCDKGNACGICPGCKKVLAGTHADVYRIDRQEDKAHVVVADIDFIVSEAAQISFEGGRKVFFVPEANLMVEHAQNKLLKILEEPPENTTFLLGIDNIRNILPTILSRCIIVRVSGSDNESVKNALIHKKNVGISDADVIATTSNGDYYYAERLYDSGYMSIRNDMTEVVRRLLVQKNKAISQMMAKITENEKNTDLIFLALSVLLNDCILLKTTCNPKICNRDIEEKLKEFVQISSLSRIVICSQFVYEAESRKKQSTGVSNQLLFETMLFKILEKTV